MSNINKAMLIGRLSQDPDVRYTQSNTAVCNLNIATNDRYKDKSGEWKKNTEFHRCVAWGRTAEICQEYLKKGSQVYVEGPIETKKWEDKEGRERYTTEIKVLKLTMLDSNRSEKSNSSIDSSTDLNESMDEVDEQLPF